MSKETVMLDLGVMGEHEALVEYDWEPGERGSRYEPEIQPSIWIERITIKGVELYGIMDGDDKIEKAVLAELMDKLAWMNEP